MVYVGKGVRTNLWQQKIKYCVWNVQSDRQKRISAEHVAIFQLILYLVTIDVRCVACSSLCCCVYTIVAVFREYIGGSMRCLPCVDRYVTVFGRGSPCARKQTIF